jgi:hypothetical protein
MFIFYIISFIIYSLIFFGTALSFIKFKKNINGKKIMFWGLTLIVLGFGFLNVPEFKILFPLLNFLTLLLGIVLSYIGFCYKD